jgi:hypothetical protein
LTVRVDVFFPGDVLPVYECVTTMKFEEVEGCGILHKSVLVREENTRMDVMGLTS